MRDAAVIFQLAGPPSMTAWLLQAPSEAHDGVGKPLSVITCFYEV